MRGGKCRWRLFIDTDCFSNNAIRHTPCTRTYTFTEVHANHTVHTLPQLGPVGQALAGRMRPPEFEGNKRQRGLVGSERSIIDSTRQKETSSWNHAPHLYCLNEGPCSAVHFCRCDNGCPDGLTAPVTPPRPRGGVGGAGVGGGARKIRLTAL